MQDFPEGLSPEQELGVNTTENASFSWGSEVKGRMNKRINLKVCVSLHLVC